MEEIRTFYEQTSEAVRLESGSGLLEFARTVELLTRYLPPPPAKIIDVGGGPGKYASWLAEKGYEVYLLDPVEKHLEQARELKLAGVQHGDARELPCEDGVADAVLLMGPLYHLTERSDRLQALKEARRALCPGGVLLAAAITRYASLLHSLIDGFFEDEAFWPILQRDLEEGQHRNDTGLPQYFTTSVFHKPYELRSEVKEAGFCHIEILGIEGPGWLAKNLDERWKDERLRERLMILVRKVEKEEPLFGCSLHLMAVGRNEG